MSQDPSLVIQSLLLSAPPEQRVNLAIASLLYAVRKEYLEVIQLGQRQVIPVYLFFDQRRNYDVFFCSPEFPLTLPSREGKPSPDRVPSYTSDPERIWEIQTFVHSSVVACSQGELTVMVSNGILDWEETVTCSSRVQLERETCRLMALATLHVYAPALLPLLDAKRQQEECVAPLPAEHIQRSLIQELVLVPVILPRRQDDRCQYQGFDLRFGIWRLCEQEWEDQEGTCCPGPCPGCGAYYCEEHFSDTKYTFTASKEEWRFYGRGEISRQVCQTCALLPEESIKRLRATRLALNGEVSPFDPSTVR